MPYLKNIGYKEDDVYWIPISGLTGECIFEDSRVYLGPCLLKTIDMMPVEARDANGPLRISILDKNEFNGFIIHGKVVQGTVKVGDKLAISPHKT